MEEENLIVIAERKFSDFFKRPDRLEASDVIYKDGFLYLSLLTYIRSPEFGCLDRKKSGNKLLGEEREKDLGYEGITFYQKSDRFYASVECAEYPDRTYRAKVHEYDCILSAEPAICGSTSTSSKIATRFRRALMVKA